MPLPDSPLPELNPVGALLGPAAQAAAEEARQAAASTAAKGGTGTLDILSGIGDAVDAGEVAVGAVQTAAEVGGEVIGGALAGLGSALEGVSGAAEGLGGCAEGCSWMLAIGLVLAGASVALAPALF
jgi:hypothetical protein